jgi:hypothetical protein
LGSVDLLALQLVAELVGLLLLASSPPLSWTLAVTEPSCEPPSRALLSFSA